MGFETYLVYCVVLCCVDLKAVPMGFETLLYVPGDRPRPI